MAIEPSELSPSEVPAVAVSEFAVAELERKREGGNGRVAILLAVAAVVAAIIGWRASIVSNDAGDAWQSSLRTTEKRAAGIMNDAQTLYQGELPMAARILQARLLADQFNSAVSGQSPNVQQALQVEAGVQDQMSQAVGQADLSSNPVYALPSGGFDLGKRMADLRASNSDLANLDPAAIETTGDALANKAVLLTYALLPTSLGALLGVLAQPLRRYRFHLLVAGTAAVALGVVVALAVEVTA